MNQSIRGADQALCSLVSSLTIYGQRRSVVGFVALALMTFEVPAGSLASDVGRAGGAGFRFENIDAGSLAIADSGRRVMVYSFGVRAKAGVPKDREHSCYVHPLYGLDGEVLTDDFPADHVHHRGLYWAWPHVRLGSADHDLWTLRGVRQKFERWMEK
jgi:hypothetical protein